MSNLENHSGTPGAEILHRRSDFFCSCTSTYTDVQTSQNAGSAGKAPSSLKFVILVQE